MMRVSTVALAAVFALSADLSFGQSSTSTYHYDLNGRIFNGNFLPGRLQWPGACSYANAVEQTPIAIDTTNPNEVVLRDDYSTSAYTFDVSDRPRPSLNLVF